jgi:hypothetical protein
LDGPEKANVQDLDSDNDTDKMDIHAVGDYSEGFTLRTCLTKTTEKRVSISGEEVDLTEEEHSEAHQNRRRGS